LGIPGVPHGHPIARFGPPKLAKSRGIEGFPPRTPLSRNLIKPANRTPFPMDWRGGSQEKEPQRVHAYIPNQIPEGEALKPPQENHQKRLRKSLKRENGRDNKRP
jgi:hypothetical protein